MWDIGILRPLIRNTKRSCTLSGYGLSYTDFEFGTPTVEHNSTDLRVKIEVKNTGAVAGKEVVQVYYSAPNGILGNPAKELAAYAKTKLLAPGESEEL